MKKDTFFAVILTMGWVMTACSAGQTPPVTPGLEEADGQAGAHSTYGTSKQLWGVWEISLDTRTWEADIVPVRGAQFTVDVVTFLQPPVGNPRNLTLRITDVSDWMTEGLIDVEVILTHPFPGFFQYTGFDVYGAFMTPAGVAGVYDSNVTYTDEVNNPVLLNADGYTRWMNPVEFPDNGTVFTFTPGKLGNPDIGRFTSTVNAYKYFADDLGTEETLCAFFHDPNKTSRRGIFTPGSANGRKYELKFPMVGGAPNLDFQYAVIASWIEPDKTLSGNPDVLDVPGDFAPNANADEAVFLGVTDNSGLWYVGGEGGGNISLELEVYDWGAYWDGVEVTDEIHQIVVESDPGVIPGGCVVFDQSALEATASPGSSLISSVYRIDIANCTPQSQNAVPLLITVESEEPDSFDPGNGVNANDDRLAGYFRHDIAVAGEAPLKVISPNGGETLWMAMSHEITWDIGSGTIEDVTIEWSTDNFTTDVRTIVDSTENDGSYEWIPIPNVETTTARVRVRDVSGGAWDSSDDDFSIALPIWLDFEDEVEVDESTVVFSDAAGAPYGYHKQWDEFSPAISQEQGQKAHICWHAFGFDYNGSGWWLRWGWDVGIRSTEGTNWTGENRFFQSSTSTDNQYEMRVDTMKLATAANNYTFAGIQLAQGANVPKVYFCAYVDHLINHKTYYYNWNCVNLTPLVYENCEVMADDKYLYMVGDSYRDVPITNHPGIYSLRVKTPSCTNLWVYETLQTLTKYGEVSHSRSWGIHGGTLVLAYYTLGGQIRLAKQTDQAADTWDDTEIIFDGTGYTDCRNPAIAVDASDRLFALWTGREDASGEYHLLVSMKETPSGEWTEPIVAASSSDPFDDQHISCSTEQILLPTGDSEYVVLIGYENNGVVQSRISPKDLWAFLPEQQVSADDMARDPDTLCLEEPYNYDALFAWSFEVDEDNWDIKFRNADFETP